MGVNVQFLEWDGSAEKPAAELRKLIALQKELEKEFGNAAKISKNAQGQIVATLKQTEVAAANVAGGVAKVSATSKRANLALQQLAFGAQDAAAVFGVTGLGGAVRAANNNLQQAIALMGFGGAYGIAFQLATIALPVLADSFWATSQSAVAATSDLEDVVEALKDVRREQERARKGEALFNESLAREEEERTRRAVAQKSRAASLAFGETFATLPEDLRRRVQTMGSVDLSLLARRARSEAASIPSQTTPGGGAVIPQRALRLQQQADALDELARQKGIQEEASNQQRELTRTIAANRQERAAQRKFVPFKEGLQRGAERAIRAGVSANEASRFFAEQLSKQLPTAPAEFIGRRVSAAVQEAQRQQAGKQFAEQFQTPEERRRSAERQADREFQRLERIIDERRTRATSRAAIARGEGRIGARQQREFTQEQNEIAARSAELQLKKLDRIAQLLEDIKDSGKPPRPPNRNGNN